MSIARHFRTLFLLALIGGLAVGAVLAQRGAKVDLGTFAGVKLVLAAPAVTPTSQVPAGLFAPGAGTQQAAPGAAAAATGATGRGTTGTVQSVVGKSISVTAQDGTVTKAAVTDSTTYAKNSAITVADLKVGDVVTVLGAAAADGTITATQLTLGGAGQAAAIGAGGFNRQGGAGGQGGTGQGTTGQGGTGGGRTGGSGGTGATTGTGASGGQFGNLTAISGSVQTIDGSVVTVAVSGGQPTKVVLGANARLSKTAAATLADVTVGEQVTIVGQAGADGVVAAVLVQIAALR